MAENMTKAATDCDLPVLTPEEREIYAWQIDVEGFGESGQRKLRNASVLVTRVGGLGSLVAYELAAAGLGHLVLAHGGEVKPSDLNRQLLMTHDWLGKPRVESAVRRLRELNPYMQVTTVAENASPDNARDLVEQVDLVVDCAPLFEERFALNEEIVRQEKPMVECGMYDLEAQITTILPGHTPCLRCLVPEQPNTWTRRFPVFGAIAGSLGCIAAMEAIKVLAGFGETLASKLLIYNLRQLQFRTLSITRRADCQVCGQRS